MEHFYPIKDMANTSNSWLKAFHFPEAEALVYRRSTRSRFYLPGLNWLQTDKGTTHCIQSR